MQKDVSLWKRIAEPIPADLVQWRQDGAVKSGANGGAYARFVPYIDAQVVRSRLDDVVPGEWDMTLEPLGQCSTREGDSQYAFKCRIQILGVIREDIGQGHDFKSAATDALKRAGMRFGIASNIYTDYEGVNVRMNGTHRGAQPLEDPAKAWERKLASKTPEAADAVDATPVQKAESQPTRTDPVLDAAIATIAATPATNPAPECPKCAGPMWDNRPDKRNPRAPDFKCKEKACGGAIWPKPEQKPEHETQAA